MHNEIFYDIAIYPDTYQQTMQYLFKEQQKYFCYSVAGNQRKAIIYLCFCFFLSVRDELDVMGEARKKFRKKLVLCQHTSTSLNNNSCLSTIIE